jgi:hypothetical protein
MRVTEGDFVVGGFCSIAVLVQYDIPGFAG